MFRFVERVLNLLGLRQPDRDLAREIETHLALLQESYEARGLPPERARRAARLALGNVEQLKAEHRDARSFRWLEEGWQDAALGIRLLRRSPVFAATASLSLAIGIGANTAIFTVANSLLLRPPAGITNPSELVVIGSARGDGGVNPVNHAFYLDIARRTTSLSSVFAEDMFPHVMGLMPSASAMAEPVLGRYVTTNYFSALGASPSRGRTFAESDESVAVLDYDYWRRRFSGDETIIGQALRLNGRLVTVVGVAASDFDGTGVQKCDVWLAFGSGPKSGSVAVGGRRRPGPSFEAVVAELTAVAQSVNRDQGHSGDDARRLNVLSFSRAGGNRNVVRGFAGALMVLVSLVLAAACANVAGIMLTRASARAKEMALRAALGAGRARLVRQLFTETIVLFLFSGLVGIGLARALLRAVVLLLPPMPASIVVPLTLDWRVLLFALTLSLTAALVFGVVPALRGSKVQAASSLKDGVRSSGRSRLRSAFVAGQIACSVLLVVLAASFVRVLRFAGAAGPGFDARGVDVATLDSAVTGERGGVEFWTRAIDRVRQTPAVQSASLARVAPGGFEGIGIGAVARSDQSDPAALFFPAWNIVHTGYFATLRIPISAGRDFAPSDAAGAPLVIIVSEALAQRLWSGQPAIGKRVRIAVNAGDGRDHPHEATVVGVAGDIRSTSLIDGLAQPYVYLPLAQSEVLGNLRMTGQMSIVARRRGDASLAPAMAVLVQEIDPRLVLTRAESLADAIALGLTPQRVLASISGVMGVVALFLASMGIYGVTAYSSALRRREFAIRLALGAPRARVVRIVFTQGTWLVVSGLGIGLALAIGAGQVLAVFFYGLPTVHVPTIVGTVLLFIGVGTVASLVPAGQAVRDGWRRALQEE